MEQMCTFFSINKQWNGNFSARRSKYQNVRALVKKKLNRQKKVNLQFILIHFPHFNLLSSFFNLSSSSTRLHALLQR
jgi:hypothetical protein